MTELAKDYMGMRGETKREEAKNLFRELVSKLMDGTYRIENETVFDENNNVFDERMLQILYLGGVINKETLDNSVKLNQRHF